MSKSTVYTWVGIVFVFILGLFGIYLIGKGQDCTENCARFFWLSGFCIIFAVGVVVYLYLRDRKKNKIPFPKIKGAYIKAMENHEKISINPLAETFKLTEEGNRYVFVLKDTVDDIPTFYSCEADMFGEGFGRGFGQKTNSEVEALYWYQTRKKVDIGKILAKETTKQMLREFAIKTKQQEAALQKGEFH